MYQLGSSSLCAGMDVVLYHLYLILVYVVWVGACPRHTCELMLLRVCMCLSADGVV